MIEALLPYIHDGFFDVSINDRSLTLKVIQDGAEIEKNGGFYIGAQNDTNIQHVIIRILKQVEGKDLSTTNYIRIFMPHMGIEIPIDKCLYSDDNYIYIDWIIEYPITEIAGQTQFSLCLQNKTEELVNWEFNTQPAPTIIVATLHKQELIELTTINAYKNIDSWNGAYYTFANSPLTEMDKTDITPIITIQEDTRELIIPNNFNFGVETDHNIKIVGVQFPNSFDGIVFDNTWKGFISYCNANGEEDKTELTYIGNSLYLFRVPIGITENAGTVTFAFSLVKYKDSTKLEYVFNSQPNQASVFATVAGGEKLLVMSDQQFNERFIPALHTHFSPTLEAYFANNNVVFDGDIW